MTAIASAAAVLTSGQGGIVLPMRIKQGIAFLMAAGVLATAGGVEAQVGGSKMRVRGKSDDIFDSMGDMGHDKRFSLRFFRRDDRPTVVGRASDFRRPGRPD